MFEAYCKQTLGIPQQNIRMAKDASLNIMRFQLDWLEQVMEAFNGEASAIVYYAGHGIPDESSRDAYLLPADGYPSNLMSAYSLNELYKKLGAMPAQRIMLFLDACFSGSKRNGHMLMAARGVAIKSKEHAPQGKVVVFSAAQGNETAYPYSAQRHGMFTYYLLRKLKETRGEVSLGELSDYVTMKVKQQSIVENSKLQTPTISVSQGLFDSWKSIRMK